MNGSYSKRTGYIINNKRKLFYQIKGKGPILLIIPGGEGNPKGLAKLEDLLSKEFTVITSYRINANTENKIEETTTTIYEYAEDLSILYKNIQTSQDPIFLLGLSIGAVIGLSFLSSFPQLVHKLIAFEPFLPNIFEGIEQNLILKSIEEVKWIFRKKGLSEAIQLFYPLIDSNLKVSSAKNRSTYPMQQQLDLQYFFSNDLEALCQFFPDLNKLKLNKSKLLIGVKQKMDSTIPSVSTKKLSHLLSLPLHYFPGGHFAYQEAPDLFAKELLKMLDYNIYEYSAKYLII